MLRHFPKDETRQNCQRSQQRACLELYMATWRERHAPDLPVEDIGANIEWNLFMTPDNTVRHHSKCVGVLWICWSAFLAPTETTTWSRLADGLICTIHLCVTANSVISQSMCLISWWELGLLLWLRAFKCKCKVCSNRTTLRLPTNWCHYEISIYSRIRWPIKRQFLHNPEWFVIAYFSDMWAGEWKLNISQLWTS